MMADKRTRKQWVTATVIPAVLVYSAAGTGYSGLAYFSSSMAGDVLRGLAKPTWGYIYDGGGEGLTSLLLLILGIACLEAVIATVLTLPVTLSGLSNLWRPYPWMAKAGKFVCNVLRVLPKPICAIIFVRMVEPGPFAGVLAISVHQIGVLSKLYIEEMETMEESLVETMTTVGAGFWQTMFFVRIPQLIPIYSSLSLSHFEIAMRSTTILGLAGAGGIGTPLVFAIQARNWDKVSVILIGVIVAVLATDSLAGYIHKKLRQGLRQKKERV